MLEHSSPRVVRVGVARSVAGPDQPTRCNALPCSREYTFTNYLERGEIVRIIERFPAMLLEAVETIAKTAKAILEGCQHEPELEGTSVPLVLPTSSAVEVCHV
jgi:hypothetical protein